jgi:hypothetical protein
MLFKMDLILSKLVVSDWLKQNGSDMSNMKET